MPRFVRSLRLPAIALLALAGSAARADTLWNVFATFDDGGTLSGTFAVDQYGYFTDRAITTTAGTTFGGFAYTDANSSRASNNVPTDSPYYIALYPVANANGPNEPQYTTQLRLTFAHTLADLSVVQEAITTGDQTSFECFGNASDSGCGGATPSSTVSPRYVVSGYARLASAGAAPEPATWAMMIVGFGMIGAAMRRPIRYRLSAARPA